MRKKFDFWADMGIFFFFILIFATGLASFAGFGIVAMIGIMIYKYWLNATF